MCLIWLRSVIAFVVYHSHYVIYWTQFWVEISFVKALCERKRWSEIEDLCMHECKLFFHTVSFIQLYFLLHTSLVAAPILSIITFVPSFTLCVSTCHVWCTVVVKMNLLCMVFTLNASVGLKYWRKFMSGWVTYFWGIIFCTKTSVYFAVTISYLNASQSNCFHSVVSQSIKIRHMYKHHWKLPLLISWIHFQSLYPHWPVIKPVAVRTIQPAGVHNKPFVLWHIQ